MSISFPEMIEKAKTAKTPEELLSLAKENSIGITPENAQIYFERLHKTGEVSDNELENVTGGCGSTSGIYEIYPNRFDHGAHIMKEGCKHCRDILYGDCMSTYFIVQTSYVDERGYGEMLIQCPQCGRAEILNIEGFEEV